MSTIDPQISENPVTQAASAPRPVIRQLDDSAINRIAAGEVVERPASAVKELVENAIDAGATRITVEIADGGKTLIRVTDNGCGMTPQDLPLALSRHATSKIDGSDLLNIHTFGFRGEALPSLGAVGRLTITSRAEGHDAAQIRVAGGQMEAVKPAALRQGSIVELRDLFFATAGAAEIHAHRPGRKPGDLRHREAAGDGGACGGLYPARCVRRWRGARDLPGRPHEWRSV